METKQNRQNMQSSKIGLKFYTTVYTTVGKKKYVKTSVNMSNPVNFVDLKVAIKNLQALNHQRLQGCTPGAIRTHDLQSRSLTLYPTELRALNRSNDTMPCS